MSSGTRQENQKSGIMSDDDDLRFGDVQSNKEANSQSTSPGIDIQPLGVGAIVILLLLLMQPMSGSFSGISMNIVGAAVVLIGALTAAFSDTS